MRKRERVRFGAILGLTLALMTGGVGLASLGSDPSPGDVVSCQPAEDPTGNVASEDTAGETEEAEEAEDSQGSEDPQESDETEASDETEVPDGCDEPTVHGQREETTATENVAESASTEPTPERIAACTGAAGLTAGDLPTQKPEPGELHGLQNAIAHVLWNCTRTDNDGLVNALEHLKANLDRKLEREAAKTERRAARDAEKAERTAARQAAKAERKSSGAAATGLGS
jgi:hypothetical protein